VNAVGGDLIWGLWTQSLPI